ncbi:NUDIX hydrolase [Marinigracilibium pacificum]|uniref:NUDIX hydrolase n=1 Tax=Marinigracilibium pacificum TaxID=2729599 RepID=A0A848IYA6_9BACT|nr:NUDIX hydrolase [Marinigracilibium pacificum]NMM49267.1 NUDIX hydrolase [Marinigracilibium pacificum]
MTINTYNNPKTYVIGQFQWLEIPYSFKHLFSDLENNDLIFIITDSKLTATAYHPFSAHRRKTAIEKAFPESLVEIIPDAPSNTEWSDELDELINTTGAIINNLIFMSAEGLEGYTGKYKQFSTIQTIDLEKGLMIPENEDDFLMGVRDALMKQYPKVFPTVDMALWKNNYKEFLLVRKPQEMWWRFVGGFSDPTDDSFEEAGKRELIEEVGNIEFGDLTYEGSFKIDDWRYRYERDKIITTLYSCEYISGDLEPKDDIEELQWFSIENINQMKFGEELAPEHESLFKMILKKYL